MSEILIMDKSQMETLSQRFRQKAAEVERLRHEITGLLAGTTWDGNRARRFRDEWTSVFAPNLTKLQRALDDNATLVTRERANAITAMD